MRLAPILLKGGGSDQGRAMHDLVRVADRAIGLTGTLFGGVSSSLFWIEWAFNPRLYRQYPLDPNRGAAINRWVRANGVLEKIIEYKEDGSSSGRYTTVRRIEHAPQEAPGISPRLVSELIDHTLWVGLRDLNFALPDYEDIPVEVDLPGDVQAEYDRAQRRMKAHLLERRNEGDASFLSTYLQAVLRYPSSCFRAKPVIHRLKERDAQGQRIEQHVVTIKGFPEERLYPKEQELIDLLTKELGEDRRCVVFVAQTSTLDIQPRLEALIKQHVPGAKPFIMQAGSPATDRRDAYLEKQVRVGYNVLIVNPRLVQTGMDLLAFPTLIFAEMDYSLYVTSQAARRAWRIGQAHPCRTYYLYYSGTMETQAIALISRKQAAAALLGGDADGGGLAQLSGGSNSLLAELAKTIAEDEQVVDATQLFRQKAEESLDFTSGWAASIAEKAKQAPQPADIPSPASEPEAKEPATTITSPDNTGEKDQLVTPVSALARYQAIKRQFPRALVRLEMGDFYEAFHEDAKTLAEVLDIVLTSRKLGDKRLPMAGIPRKKVEGYIARLIEAGHHVALATANGSVPTNQALKPERTLTARVLKLKPANEVKSSKKPARNHRSKPEKAAVREPHADLYGKAFIDPEDRELTVTGPNPLFPETHVQIQREGRAYGIPAEKVRRFTPVKPNGHQTQTGENPGQSDDDYYADRADQREREHDLLQPETACHVPQPALL